MEDKMKSRADRGRAKPAPVVENARVKITKNTRGVQNGERIKTAPVLPTLNS
jgi:hypothetical protein